MMNQRYIIRKRSPRPVIRFLKYCPKLTLTSLMTIQNFQGFPSSPPKVTLSNSKLRQSFIIQSSPQSQMKRYLSVDVYRSNPPQTILKSTPLSDRKFSYLSFQRTTTEQESPAKQQDSIYQIEYADDTVYFGQINITKRHGMGAMYDKNKNLIYLGQWDNDKYHGLGILVKNGLTYKGEFVNGVLEGQVIEEGNKSKFYGYYKNGQKNGPGTLYEHSKTTNGIWKNDILDQEC
ncbi:unnamed protein product [Paramecium pentaurelia]|uniref:MORN repeat protein n=1 Tax=Paramecium pentaurelia TaxID=43138 RepID=A0A8S1SPS5_9CILI|nr:unnamed protein product [Paramecium pentaurelia]